MAPASKPISRRLIKLEREITAILNPGRNHKQTGLKKGSTLAKFFKIIGKPFAYSANQTQAMAASGSNLNPIAANPVPRANEPKMATRVKRTSKGEVVGRSSALGFFLSICLGLLAICGVIIALLFLQIKDMKVEMANFKQRLAATDAHLNKFEKSAQQQIANEPKISDAPRRLPITLSNDDIKAIRAFIKVLPPKPGAQQKIRIGDAILDTGSAPVPESLVSQMPKLRGAKFLVDQNSAIIIIGEGSNRAEAVIAPQ
jgi:hypothetical protein